MDEFEGGAGPHTRRWLNTEVSPSGDPATLFPARTFIVATTHHLGMGFHHIGPSTGRGSEMRGTSSATTEPFFLLYCAVERLRSLVENDW